MWPAAFVGILLGLYFYWRPARAAFPLFLIASISLAAFEGVRVMHPVDIVVGSPGPPNPYWLPPIVRVLPFSIFPLLNMPPFFPSFIGL